MKFLLSSLSCMLTLMLSYAQPGQPYVDYHSGQLPILTDAGASLFTNQALSCLQKEYPNKLNQVLPDSTMLQEPHQLHPAFYGCFDWHSAVHGHWMLVRLLREFPDLRDAARIRQAFAENLSAANIQTEVRYFEQASKSWERTYGWAWLLKLAEELHHWEDPQARVWEANLQPLVEAIIQRYTDFLKVQFYPVRTGVHPNTAFGLAFAWDYADALDRTAFKNLIEERARFYYQKDIRCPANWEPSGEDFLSPCLEEAELMARVLSKEEFEPWFEAFLPAEQLENFATPADVSDRSDPKIVHLDGLNLSRAWCLYAIQEKLSDPELQGRLKNMAILHLEATIPHVASGHYEGSHWLASFAIQALFQ